MHTHTHIHTHRVSLDRVVRGAPRDRKAQRDLPVLPDPRDPEETRVLLVCTLSVACVVVWFCVCR